MREKIRVQNLYGFCNKMVNLHCPNNMPWVDKREIRFSLMLVLSPICEFMYINEASRISGRFIYQECKNRGWRKKRINGSKTVLWDHEKSFVEHKRSMT